MYSSARTSFRPSSDELNSHRREQFSSHEIVRLELQVLQDDKVKENSVMEERTLKSAIIGIFDFMIVDASDFVVGSNINIDTALKVLQYDMEKFIDKVSHDNSITIKRIEDVKANIPEFIQAERVCRLNTLSAFKSTPDIIRSLLIRLELLEFEAAVKV